MRVEKSTYILIILVSVFTTANISIAAEKLTKEQVLTLNLLLKKGIR